MKQTIENDDMRPDYDFSGAVNRALRMLIDLANGEMRTALNKK